jgi:predicted Zn-dependent protease
MSETSQNKEKIDLVKAYQLFSQGKTIAQALGAPKETLDTLYAVAVGDYEAKRYEDAVVGLQNLIGLDQNNPSYWALVGNALRAIGRYQEALYAWNICMSLDPKFATAMTIARVAVALKDKTWAVEGLMMALAHVGDNPKNMADYQELFNQYEKL